MADIPSASITVFRQSTALTGWTKLTTLNDYMLRVVSGTVSTGGTKTFSQTFASVTPTGSVSGSGVAGDTALTVDQIAAHQHSYSIVPAPFFPGPLAAYRIAGSTSTLPTTPKTTFTYNMTSTGSGSPHTHPLSISLTSSPGFTGTALDFNVKYVDVILAQRN